MTNKWMAPLEQIQVILLDYSSLFEVGHSPVFKSLSDFILEQHIQIVLCDSFNYLHSCVFRAMNANEKTFLMQVEEFLDMLSREKLLIADSSAVSIFTLLPKYSNRKDACLFTSIHSSVYNQIRQAKPDADYSICLFDKDKFEFFRELPDFFQTREPYYVSPVASSSDYLDVAIYVNIGDNVYIDNGESVFLSEKISTGSEGLVFRTHDPKMVAKIYHRGVMTALRWMKLTRMTKMGLLAKGICWPTSLLYNQNHEPVGYLMPVGEGNTLGSVFDGQDAIMEHFPDWDRNSVAQAACQIFEKIIYLHLHGILIGDIQLKNIMIKSPREVYLIDMDSVQLEDLPCPVGTEEFTPPELWDRSFSTFLRNLLHEDYSCGILAFSLLFCGQHPYNQRLGHETLREEIISLSFPYKTDLSDKTGIPLGGYDKIWEAIPAELRTMFCCAFAEGKRYETVEWYAAIDSYKDQLSSKSFQDPQAYLLFPYTNHIVVNRNEDKPAFKRSIRESIIHVPESTDNGRFTTDRVMYNGRSTGVAFVNQEKLTELELEKLKINSSDNKQPYPAAKTSQTSCKSVPSSSNISDRSKPVISSDKQLYPVKQKTSKKKSVKGSYRKGKQFTTLLILFILVIVVLGVLILITVLL